MTGKDKLILAEFLYGGVPHETFHFNQAEESKLMYLMKVNVLPPLYWSQMLKGNWEGTRVKSVMCSVSAVMNVFALANSLQGRRICARFSIPLAVISRNKASLQSPWLRVACIKPNIFAQPLPRCHTTGND